MEGVIAMRPRFNAILNDAAQHFGFHHIYIECCGAEKYFDCMGNLNPDGQLEMWREINNLIEKFDCRKISLKPKVDEFEKEDYLKHKSQNIHKKYR